MQNVNVFTQTPKNLVNEKAKWRLGGNKTFPVTTCPFELSSRSGVQNIDCETKRMVESQKERW